MGLRQYRNIDLTILLIIMCALECASLLVLRRYVSSFYLSVVMVVTLIVYMRWGFWGAIYGIIGGTIDAVLILYVNSATDSSVMAMSSIIKWSLVYSVGYLMTTVSMFFFKLGKAKLSSKLYWVLLYAVSAYLLMCLGRSVVLAVYGENFFNALVGQFTREFLNLVFTFLVLLVARKQDSVFADQKEYFESHKVRR